MTDNGKTATYKIRCSNPVTSGYTEPETGIPTLEDAERLIAEYRFRETPFRGVLLAFEILPE